MVKRDRILTVILALLLLAGPVAAAPPQPAAAGSSVGATEIVLRVRTPGYTLDAAGLRVKAPGGGAYARHDAAGAPDLPVWGAAVALPPTGEWAVSVAPGAAVLIPVAAALPAVPVPQPILPGAAGWDDTDRPTAVPVVDRPDPAIYRADAFYPASVVQAGPVQWQRGQRLLAVRVFPFQYNPAAGVVRFYADMTVTVRVERDASAQTAGLSMTEEAGGLGVTEGAGGRDASAPAGGLSMTAGGNALRIRTAGRGMVRLTYEALVAADPAVAGADPATFAVSYLGDPVAIRLIQATAGPFAAGDSVVFYAEPYQGRYQTENVYGFTWGGAGSPRMATRSVTPAGGEPIVTAITRTLHLENNKTYLSTITRPRDVDHWFDTIVGPLYAPISHTLALSDTILTGNLVLRALINSGAAQSTNDRSVSLRLNTHPVGTFAWSGLVDHLIETTVPASWLDASPNKLGIWPGVGNVYPDWTQVTYPSRARAYGDKLYIEAVAPGANEVVVTGFTAPDTPGIADVVVYDVRDPRQPALISAPALAYDADTGTYAQHFWDEALPGPTYFLSKDAALAAPLAVEKPAQDGTPLVLSSATNQADYIAIVHRSLWGAIDPLLAHRADPAGDNFAVAKVDVQQIYDEFAHGRRDPEAIRSFLAYAYANWRGPAGDAAAPQYVLLVGSGTYDFTGVTTSTKPNLVPPYLIRVDPWIGETAADNRFVSLDGPDDFLPEMAIGRIPAQTPEEVTIAVDKILAYETTAPGGDWQQRVVYVADNCADSAGDFHWLSNQARFNVLPATYDDRTVYYGNPTTCPQSDYSTASGMQAGIRAGFDDGAFMLQWFGHAGRNRWGTAAEYPSGQLPIYVFSSNVAPTLAANTVWPITFSYTCWSGYFINLTKYWFVDNSDKSIGEAVTVMAAGRGSVADVSPSGQHVGGALVTLNHGMTQAIFQDLNDRMGPAVDAGKLYYFSHAGSFFDVIDTSVLFGDPATRLRLPPLVRIGQDPTVPTTLMISWEHVAQYTRYEVRRSERPYFNWDDPDAESRGIVPAPPAGTDVVFFEDEGAIGDPAVNYYYLVGGVNAAGTTGIANRTGEFDFALVEGD